MRFKVPQNIDIEDRILGPLTMVQFIYAVIGGGICYVIYTVVPAPFSYVLISPIALFVFCLIFVKINERPFIIFLVSMLQFNMTPKQRVWRHGDDPDIGVEIYESKVQTGPTIQSKNITREQIIDIAKRLDNGEDLQNNNLKK